MLGFPYKHGEGETETFLILDTDNDILIASQLDQMTFCY